ncbi:conserved hypothetical protein [delta proteobacterium NaphS2]|nr:conserved hypothetical protein [delta proteobacterium NaphS2]
MGLAVRDHLPVEIGHLLHEVMIVQQNGSVGPNGQRMLIAGDGNPGIGCSGFVSVGFHVDTSFLKWLFVRLTVIQTCSFFLRVSVFLFLARIANAKKVEAVGQITKECSHF